MPSDLKSCKYLPVSSPTFFFSVHIHAPISFSISEGLEKSASEVNLEFHQLTLCRPWIPNQNEIRGLHILTSFHYHKLCDGCK